MEVLSFINGRIRIKSDIFKIKTKAQLFKELLEDIELSTNVSYNSISGTMIINYKNLDKNTFKKKLILEFLKFKKTYCREGFLKRRKAIYHILMSGALGLTIGSIIIKKKKIHAISGIIFTLISLEHMRINRKLLFKKQKYLPAKHGNQFKKN